MIRLVIDVLRSLVGALFLSWLPGFRRCRRCAEWSPGSYCGGCGGFRHVRKDVWER